MLWIYAIRIHEWIVIYIFPVLVRNVQYAINEVDQQVQAIAEGLAQVVPARLFFMLRWDELSTLVCGIPSCDLALLREATVYSDFTTDSPRAKHFWAVCVSFHVDIKMFKAILNALKVLCVFDCHVCIPEVYLTQHHIPVTRLWKWCQTQRGLSFCGPFYHMPVLVRVRHLSPRDLNSFKPFSTGLCGVVPGCRWH